MKNLHKLSAMQLHEAFINGDVTAVAITSGFISHIEKHDANVGAFLQLFKEKALEKAEHLDKKRSQGVSLGRLAAVPVGIKDNIHIKDELTTCASKFLTNYKAPFNSTVTELLEAEDAIFLGKTNMDEFAMGSSTENSALKKTANPWNLECVPGGSSGGSAAAVAARFCPLAFGSDTGGSIRQPASLCGVVGFKPTYGRVSRYGLVAFGSSLDQIGPMSANVKDAALAMEIIGRHCVKDSTSLNDPVLDILKKIEEPLNGLRIGVPWHFLEGLTKEARATFDAALEVYKGLGASIVEVDLSIFKYGIAVYYILATAEASTNLARFDGIRYGVRAPEAKTLDEIYDLSKEEGFGSEVKRRIMLGTYVLSAGYQDEYYRKAQRVRTLLKEGYQTAFNACDIIATPVSPMPAWKVGEIKDPLQMYLSDVYTISANLGGVPAISVPCGFSKDGLPIGLQLTGAQKADAQVLHTAYAFEKATKYHEKLPAMC